MKPLAVVLFVMSGFTALSSVPRALVSVILLTKHGTTNQNLLDFFSYSMGGLCATLVLLILGLAFWKKAKEVKVPPLPQRRG